MTTIHRGQDVNGLTGLGSGSADKARAAHSHGAPPQGLAQPSPTSQSDAVEITPTAQLLAQLEQQLSGTPDVNQSRVSAISQALGNDSYQVDSGRIADGVLAAQKFNAQAASAAAPGPQSNPAKIFADTAKG